MRALAVALVVLAQAAAADEHGFRIEMSIQMDTRTIPHAASTEWTGGHSTGTATLRRAGVVDEELSLEGVTLSRRSPDDFRVDAVVTLTAETGDQLWLTVVRTSGDFVAGGVGEMSVLGGTGRYEGLTGRCTYEVVYDGSPTTIVTADCS